MKLVVRRKLKTTKTRKPFFVQYYESAFYAVTAGALNVSTIKWINECCSIKPDITRPQNCQCIIGDMKL